MAPPRLPEPPGAAETSPEAKSPSPPSQTPSERTSEASRGFLCKPPWPKRLQISPKLIRRLSSSPLFCAIYVGLRWDRDRDRIGETLPLIGPVDETASFLSLFLSLAIPRRANGESVITIPEWGHSENTPWLGFRRSQSSNRRFSPAAIQVVFESRGSRVFLPSLSLSLSLSPIFFLYK